MSCLVIIAVQESSGALVGAEDLGVSLEDPGFGNMSSSAMDTLNAIHSLSSSTSSLHDGPVDRRAHMDRVSDRSMRKYDASSSPHILLDRSHDHDDDMIRPKTVPAVRASSTLSESLADAFGSELASAGTSDKHPTRGNSTSSGSSGRSNSSINKIKRIIIADLQRSTTDESDLELISRTGSGLPSTGMSMESSFTASTRAGSWQDTSPAVQESRSKDQSRNSPRPIPTRASSGTTQSSRTRLEMDLAEAATTPSPGSVSSFSSLPATAIGIHPTLESFASTPGSRRRRSQVSSRRLSAEEGMEQDAATPRGADSQRDISISSTPSLPSPSHSAAVREVPEQDVQDHEEEERSVPEHHSFYALGIHGQTSNESYAREIEESMSRTPPLDSKRSSLSSSLGPRALEQSDSDKEGASAPVTSSHDDDVEDEEDVEDHEDDAIEAADEQRETAAARHLGKEDSGSRETKLGSDSESEDETSLPLAPPSKVSAQGSPELEGEQDDNDKHNDLRERESESENENEGMSESENSVRHQENMSSSSLATRPLSTASSSTLLTDDSFLSSIGSSSSTHDHGHGEDGDEDEDDEHGRDEDDGEDSPRLDSSFTLTGPVRQPLTREERKQEQQRLKRKKRRLLVDDAKRKQEQLDRIKAQLELKDLGKIRQQVSFWEEKGILEQKVVAMVEVEEEPEEPEGPPQSKDEASSPGKHCSADDPRAIGRQERSEEDASLQDKTLVIQGKMADFTLGEPLSPGNNQLSGYDEPPKPAGRKQAATDQMTASASSESDLAVFLSDVD
ncbi:hypothetical protein BGZ68_010063 [Mortierella alpina]|nr:hypothetical protein BGZ68_010063 [Mortierella alpina]